jgi:hypothetical protein
LCFVNLPIALNATVPPVGTALGPELNTVVLVAAGRGVNVGVGVFPRIGVFVADGFGEGVNVAVGAGPFAIVMETSEKPGLGVGVALPPPPLLQLITIAPKTNNATGATASHLSHLDNIEP